MDAFAAPAGTAIIIIIRMQSLHSLHPIRARLTAFSPPPPTRWAPRPSRYAYILTARVSSGARPRMPCSRAHHAALAACSYDWWIARTSSRWPNAMPIISNSPRGLSVCTQ